MSRIIGILAVVGILAAALFASAAALPVDGGTIQAGEDRDLVCDADGIYVSAWAVNTYPVGEGVESVKVKGVSSACNGARLMGRVELSGSDWNDNATWAYTSATGPYGSSYAPVVVNGDSNTEYTLYLKKSDYTTQWYVPAEQIVGVKFWLEP